MQQGLATILQVVIGSGLGAGFVTFMLNFWKAERDFRRAKLEELYAAVHKYTVLMSLISLRVRTERFNLSEEQGEVSESFDLINLLVDLYFPQLKSIFMSFRKKNQDFIANQKEGVFRTDNEKFQEGFLDLVQEGDNLKRAVVDLARRKRIFRA